MAAAFAGAGVKGASRDIRYAARLQRKSLGFAFLAILLIGLGIAANTILFSVIEAVFLRAGSLGPLQEARLESIRNARHTSMAGD